MGVAIANPLRTYIEYKTLNGHHQANEPTTSQPEGKPQQQLPVVNQSSTTLCESRIDHLHWPGMARE